MLEVRGLRAGYGAINVLWDVDLAVAPGRLTTIIGPNGAGKTTLLRAIMRQIATTAGDIRLDGQSLAGVRAWQMAARGVTMIPEGRMLFHDLSVEENLLLGAYPMRDRPGSAARLEAAYARFPALSARRRQLAGSLSGGEAQMLSLARGLAGEPRLLLIDEPSLGLAPVLVSALFAELARLKREGRTIVLVEQNTRRAVEIADDVHLLQGGRVVLSQPAAQVDLRHLHERYFARSPGA
jgi:branched-chain amino acid transport system ATP-binding protein